MTGSARQPGRGGDAVAVPEDQTPPILPSPGPMAQITAFRWHARSSRA